MGIDRKIISRKDFLKIGGVGLLAITGLGGLASQYLSDEAINPTELDLMNNHELFVGERGEQFSKKIQSNLGKMFDKIIPKVFEDDNADAFKDQTNLLLEKVKADAEAIQICREQGYLLTENHLKDNYYEKSSFLQALLNISNTYDTYGHDGFSQVNARGDLATFIGTEKMTSFWATQMRGNIYLQKLLSSPEALLNIPTQFKGDERCIGFPADLKVYMRKDESLQNQRPSNVFLEGFDPRIKEDIETTLVHIGLNRSLDWVTLTKTDHPDIYGSTWRRSDLNSTRLYWPEKEELTLEEYLANKPEVEYVITHEAIHVLSGRRNYIQSLAKRLELRECELRSMSRFDLSNNLGRFINPEETVDQRFPFLRNSMRDMTLYYTLLLQDQLVDRSAEGNMSINVLFQELSRRLSSDNIVANLDPGDSETLDEYFGELEKKMTSFGPFSQFFGKLLLDYKKEITDQDQWKGSPYRVIPLVFPLLFLHVMAHKLPDLKNLARSNLSFDESNFIINYLDASLKDMKVTMTAFRGEELMGEIFSQAMLTKIHGEHPVQEVNDSVKDCERILEILKEEGLARNTQSAYI